MRYLLPAPVVEYIEQNGLYVDDGTNATAAPEKDKDKGKPNFKNSGLLAAQLEQMHEHIYIP